MPSNASKSVMTKRHAKREPTAAERQQIEEACDRHAGRKRPVKVELDGKDLAAPHADKVGSLITLLDTLGSSSLDYLAVNLGALEVVTRERGENRGETTAGVNAGLAIIQAIAPENELEGALAMQMAGTHSLAAEMLGRAKHAEFTDQLALYGNLAVKLQRTFTAQVEALARLRGKGQQTVRVEHVTVESGAQAIVGDVHHYRPGGTRDSIQNGDQSDEQPARRPADAPVAALSGADQAGNRVPMPRRPRKAKVPAARRDQSGRAKG